MRRKEVFVQTAVGSAAGVLVACLLLGAARLLTPDPPKPEKPKYIGVVEKPVSKADEPEGEDKYEAEDDRSIENEQDSIERTEDEQVVLSTESLKVDPVSSVGEGRYFYDQMSPEDRAVFDHVYGNVLNRTEVIQFEKPVSLELLDRIVYILRWDYPELYYLGGSFSYSRTDQGVVSYTPQYIIDAEQYEYMQGQVKEVTSWIRKQVKGMSRYRTELFIHDYLVEHCAYDKTAEYNSNVYGALIQGKAKCDGYSSAMMYLLRACDIPCMQVIGIASSGDKQEGHAWNAIEINDNWYYLDVTWDDPDGALKEAGIDVGYDYFNFPYKDMVKTRDVKETLKCLGTLPETDSEEFSYYKREGKYADSIQDVRRLMQEGIEQALSEKGGRVLIKCRSEKVYGAMKSEYKDVLQSVVNDSGCESRVSCRFWGVDARTTGVLEVRVEEADEDPSDGDGSSENAEQSNTPARSDRD